MHFEIVAAALKLVRMQNVGMRIQSVPTFRTCDRGHVATMRLICGPDVGSGLRIKKPMLAARLSKAFPRMAQAVRGRAMSSPTISEQLGSVKDVKVKDIPQWASSVQKDPKTEAAVKVQ